VAGAQPAPAPAQGKEGPRAGTRQAQEAPAQRRPPYTAPAYEEDWSDFDPALGEDFFDPIKHVDLNEDGSVWASFGGELRLRLEGWTDFLFNEDNDETFVLTRLLLHSDLHFGEQFRVFVEGEMASLPTDRDLPGGRRGLDVDELDLQNAFADLRFEPADDVFVTARVGRQELLYGKQRLVSPLPWSNSQRSWDGARGIVEFGRWRVDGFYTRFTPTEKHDFNDWEGGSDFYGLYAAGKIGGEANPLELDAYFLGLSRDSVAFNGSTGGEDRFSIGARVGGPILDSGFDFDVEGTYQFGRVGGADVSAYSLASQIGYRIPLPEIKPRLFLGFDYASGDDTPGDGDVETFNQLFPLGHAYFGYMDFIGRQNIVDLSAGLSIKPIDRLTLKLHGHLFWRASDDDALYNAGGGVVRTGNLSSASEVGQEIDLVATYRVDRHLTVEGGYAHFFAGDFLDESGPGDDVDWVYVQLTYRF